MTAVLENSIEQMLREATLAGMREGFARAAACCDRQWQRAGAASEPAAYRNGWADCGRQCAADIRATAKALTA